MTRRRLTFLWPGLLLVCCDKPEKTGSREGDRAPAVRVSRGGHVPREPATDTVAVLRAMLGTANEIESPAVREKALADGAWNAIELDSGTAGEAFLRQAALPDASIRKEAALGLEAALLQQPRDIRDAWLQYADTDILRELEEQREQAIKEVGNNIPPPQTSKGNAETSL